MNLQSSQLTPEVDPSDIDKLFDVAGLRVFVPGGYGAIGEAVATAMARMGATVAIAGPHPDKAKSLADRIRAAGGKAHGLHIDAREVDSIKETTEAVVSELGGIDVLVNCVGIQHEQPLMEVTEQVFDDVYRTNLKSAMFLAQAVAGDQIERGEGGRQIHLLSVRAQLALRGRGYSAYCATKGGMAMLVKQHAMELAPHNITVNGVAPTFIQSERIRPHLDRPDFREFMFERNPLGRIGSPLEVVGQIIAFASPAGSYMTGQIVYVDGGVTASQ
jgi:NAD(P)-dependent dehydrogenase (short-subunit alcohol dehydrogenase family)